MRKHETAVCGTARTVVWEVGKCENRRQIPFMISIYLLPDYILKKEKAKEVVLGEGLPIYDGIDLPVSLFRRNNQGII